MNAMVAGLRRGIVKSRQPFAVFGPIALAFLEGLLEFLLATVGEWGLLGIFLLMAVESSFVPFPSEAVMIPAGVLASRGEIDLGAAIVAGTAGSLVGAWINYVLALKLGRPVMHRLGRRFFVSQKTLDLVDAYFAKHGEITTLVGRLIPAVRQLISIPAGLSRMDPVRFTIFTAAGAGFWVTVLTLAGFFIGESAGREGDVLTNLTLAVVIVAGLLVAIYLLGKRYFARRMEAPAIERP